MRVEAYRVRGVVDVASRAIAVVGWSRPLSLGLTAALLGLAVFEAATIAASMTNPAVTLGMDFRVYLDAARGWLAGDGFYLPSQLAGPYAVTPDGPPILYPPTLLYALVPFTVLPAVLWWIGPLGVIAASLSRLRPSPWTWPILAAVLCYPRTWTILVYGNPSLWAFAALAAGLVWTWPLAFVPLKPTLAPLALLGVRRRALWVGVAAFALVALPFGAMWLDYLAVVTNARNGMGVEYLVGELPIGLALVVAWLGRR